MDNLEIRDGNRKDCRAEASDNGRKILGYAIVFNSLSHDLGHFREVIAPEAVDRTLHEALDVRALVDHDSGKVIGRTRAGTLLLRKDARGLRIEVDPDPGISYANDILRSVARGDISGMSFGFRVLGEDKTWWDYEADPPIRTVRDMRISEVSIVSNPAYPATDVAVAQRSLHTFQQPGRRVAFLLKLHKTRMAR